MASCCPSGGYHRFFNQRFARRLANPYRKRGLETTAQRMVEFLQAAGVEGASVLEIGGGIGEIEVELLQAGAARTRTWTSRAPTRNRHARWPSRQGSRSDLIGASMTWPRTLGRWRRPTWWSCTG
jgi:hypothetical protein